MELLGKAGPLTRTLVSLGVFEEDPLRYLDVGCSGGLPEPLRAFGNSGLLALGVDPNLGEIERLRRLEPFSGVKYRACFVGKAPSGGDQPISGTYNSRNPWPRLSAAMAQEELALQTCSEAELTRQNNWQKVDLVDAEVTLTLDELLHESHLEHVDLLKVDVDGTDLAVLQSGVGVLMSPKTLCVAVEVNYYGGPGPDENTFHNIDRLLRTSGFELFGLTTRLYSTSALPAPFLLDIPAQTVSGRVYQGDAVYVRDLAAPEAAQLLSTTPPASVFKLAALLEMFDLADCAAELLVAADSPVNGQLDVEAMLVRLKTQVQRKPHSRTLPIRRSVRHARQWIDGVLHRRVT